MEHHIRRLQQESTDITKLLKLLRLKLRTNIDHPLTPPVNNRWPSRYHCATLVEEDRTPTDLGTPQQPENHSTTTDDIEINSTAADIGDDYDIDDITVPDSEGTTPVGEVVRCASPWSDMSEDWETEAEEEEFRAFLLSLFEEEETPITTSPTPLVN
ncbi:hypothetical protein FJT64_018162 [Amphibalanus amphitrite]|uniref:Uncharacterized protein n=1 Tax=Amphibalanus amphitrite TaxID=1232801 RepID=A0A6A4WV20_AMPAM|nr:hypothetical protein FJT64_018162 [Amphibalanus amphitrite]